MCKMDSEWEAAQGAQLGVLGPPRGVGWDGVGGRLKRKGVRVHMGLIHIVLWQK